MIAKDLSTLLGLSRVSLEAMETNHSRFHDLEKLLERSGPLANANNYGSLFEPNVRFEPGPENLDFLQNHAKILVVGAGGLGCELLKDLALSGFSNIDVIDMDTIDVSNLNRQFLFRKADVGRPKATVAAECVMRRVGGVNIEPHYCAIQDKDADWYRQFQIIVMGLDSIEARRWLNAMACSLVHMEPDAGGALVPDMTSVIPLVDGGTEGFSGHVRVIYPRISACFECTLDLFPPQTAVPLCTIAETPRNAAHCVLYAHLVEAPKSLGDGQRDRDDPAYQAWVYERAAARAAQFSIEGVTLMQAQGVIKNIIPAIASTNAIVAAACALEAFKIVTNSCPYLDNNLMYMGGQGTYAPTFKYDRNPQCIACGAGVALSVAPNATLTHLIDLMAEDPRLRLRSPSLRAESGAVREEALYMAGVLAEHYKPNLELALCELITDGAVLIVTDPSVPSPCIKVMVRFAS